MKPLTRFSNLFAVTMIAGMVMNAAVAMAQCPAPSRTAPTWGYRSGYTGGTGTYSYRSYYGGAPSVAPTSSFITPSRAGSPAFFDTPSAYRRSLGKPI